LLVKIFKPKGTESDIYKTKTELASEIITELIELGFEIDFWPIVYLVKAANLSKN
jgi:hypothetical protein